MSKSVFESPWEISATSVTQFIPGRVSVVDFQHKN
jgi:hypothetical protein